MVVYYTCTLRKWICIYIYIYIYIYIEVATGTFIVSCLAISSHTQLNRLHIIFQANSVYVLDELRFLPNLLNHVENFRVF